MATTYKLVSGNVGKIYELRRVGDKNSAVINFSIATTERVRDESGNWSDGETIWTSCTAWNRKAENIEKTWKSGDQVFVYGRVKPNAYTKDGEQIVREVLEVELFGHEESVFPATQERPHRDQEGSSSSPSGSNRSAAPAQQRKPAATASKPAPKPTPAADPTPAAESDFDFDFGGEDFNFDMGSDGL